MSNEIKAIISEGKTALGIELGSTRIKAVLIGEDNLPIASGSHDWENKLENGMWTYPLDAVWAGLQDSYRKLADEVQSKYGIQLSKIGAIGISAMMHGYLVFDKAGNQLVPFRTWRNTTTAQAAEVLTERLSFNIPQRWSIAHLYQAMLNKEPHVEQIDLLTTLAGYVHWKLTGKKAVGVGEASGIFPVDSTVNQYNGRMMADFNAIVKEAGYSLTLTDIIPEVLNAGDDAGELTADGAKLLDPSGALQPGIPLCPPEGDAGTGMVATNSVAQRTGNISAGTSVFAMIVLERELSKVYMEIDMVTTPTGKPVAMVHCNSCTSDLDAWVRLFGEILSVTGAKISKAALYDALYYEALKGQTDGGGLLSYNYYSGEPITGMEEGRPLFTRLPDSNMNLANFMRTLLYSTMSTLKLGMDILRDKESVQLDQLLGHGGLFKTKGVGQRLMAGAMNVPVTVMESAGEGGAWGIALLAAYRIRKSAGESLEAYLSQKVFSGMQSETIQPNPEDVAGFEVFMKRYIQGLAIEQAAVENLPA